MTGQSNIDRVIYHLARGMVAGRTKVEYTGCPIIPLFEKTNPIYVVFRPKMAILGKNKAKTNPIFTRRSAGEDGQTQFFGLSQHD
jgi:hypothetical protein